MTPSNANTSGLELVAWRWQIEGMSGWSLSRSSDIAIKSDALVVEPLVNAASAQARIAELEALVASIRRAQRDVIRAEIEQEGYAPISDAEDRATAAEARADRLAKGLKDAEESARRYARCYEPSSDGRNTFLMLADHIHALQQEG